MLVSVCLLCSNLSVHSKLENNDQQDISDFKSVAKRLKCETNLNSLHLGHDAICQRYNKTDWVTPISLKG